MEEVREPALLQTVRGHRGEVTCLDAAGARFVSGGGDRELRLWRWEGSRGWDEAARVPNAHRYGVTAARFAPSGVLVASAGVDGVVRVWCARALAPRRTLAAPGAAAARALCWAGRARALVGHDDGALCVWHVPRAALLARLHAHEGALHAVAALACGALLLTACTDGVLKVFDLAEVCRSGASDSPPPTPLTWVDGAHDMGVLCADATEEGDLAATGGHDALVRIWRVTCGGGESGGVVASAVLAGHGAAVTALCWAARGSLLASASLDRMARLWATHGDAPTCLHVLHAHARYLTCITVSHDLRYMLTGSNDKSVRMWSLHPLSLEDELEPPCAALDHFALGDLEGIGPVEEELDAEAAPGEGSAAGGSARRLWHEPQASAGPINCIATHDHWLATASSDGWVRVYWWCEEALVQQHALEAHQYPAMAVDFGASGALLLSAGLDGNACLWDVQSGVQLRTFSAAGGAGAGEAGGGGVRGARLSPHRPAHLLLATDDGVAPLWTIDSADPRPAHVFAGHSDAVTCCAWSCDGRVLATGAASGELRVLAPPPAAALLHHEAQAHDLGVQSCDFAPQSARTALQLAEDTHLLATAGCDSFIKLWIVDMQQESCAVRLVQQVGAHGGGAASVRWSGAAGAGALLASAGADRWARVWRVSAPHCALRELVAAPAAGAGGVLAGALLAPHDAPAPLLVTGTLAGELAVWQLPLDELDDDDEDEAALPALWGPPGVARWIRENVTRAPGAAATHEEEALLIQRALDAEVTGARLVDDPVDDLLEDLGYGNEDPPEEEEVEKSEKRDRRNAIRARLRDELAWLRREPPPAAVERAAPHALQCPLSHRLLVWPARAADGYSYERANILDWFIAADGAVSPVSNRRLRNARAPPNYALRDRLRHFLLGHEQEQERAPV